MLVCADINVELSYAPRCYLFLVNYARMKPDVALKALPVLVMVFLCLSLLSNLLLLQIRTWKIQTL